VRRGSAHPRLRWSRSNRRPSPPQPRHRIRPGAAHRRRTLVLQQPGHRSPLHEPCPKSNRATPTAGSVVGNDDDGASMSATASAVLNFTSARRTARPPCNSRVSAIAVGDGRCDTPPDTGIDCGHERAAPTSVASVCTSTPLAVRQSVAESSCSNAVALREPTLGPAHTAVAECHTGARIRCVIPLPRMTITVAVPMAKVRLRVRPPAPCWSSLRQDELRDPGATPASAPSPLATSAATPCRTSMPPSLHDPASLRPTLAMTLVTSSLHRPSSWAWEARALRCRSQARSV